jgi:uncharacterized membrane-anchored protein
MDSRSVAAARVHQRSLSHALRASVVRVRASVVRVHAGERADDTSGDLRKLLTSLAQTKADADATALHKAMKGLGTDEETMLLILADRTATDLAQTRETFDRRYGDRGGLAKWIQDDTSGELRKTMLALGACCTTSLCASRVH